MSSSAIARASSPRRWPSCSCSSSALHRRCAGRQAHAPGDVSARQHRATHLRHPGPRGRRVYREGVVGLPRWGGKSQLAAALGLTLMYTEPTFEGEYYVVATTRSQAGIVFEKAKRMVLMDDLLRGVTKVYRNVMEIPETGALFRVLPWDADTAQGCHPTAAIIDEYHVHRDSSMREALLSGMVGIEQGLLITISTAGPERKGPLWDLLRDTLGEPGPYAGRHAATRAPTSTGPAPQTTRTAATRRSGARPTGALDHGTHLRDQFPTLPFPLRAASPQSLSSRARPGLPWRPLGPLRCPADLRPRRATIWARRLVVARHLGARLRSGRSPAGLHNSRRGSGARTAPRLHRPRGRRGQDHRALPRAST